MTTFCPFLSLFQKGSFCTHSQVARLTTIVAPTRTSTAQPKGWTVGLNVTQSLTVVALLGLSCPGQRALVRLVSGLLAVVAKALSRRANFGVVANVATFVAGTARERRHIDVYRSVKTRMVSVTLHKTHKTREFNSPRS